MHLWRDLTGRQPSGIYLAAGEKFRLGTMPSALSRAGRGVLLERRREAPSEG
jgi:hypothetical protein